MITISVPNFDESENKIKRNFSTIIFTFCDSIQTPFIQSQPKNLSHFFSSTYNATCRNKEFLNYHRTLASLWWLHYVLICITIFMFMNFPIDHKQKIVLHTLKWFHFLALWITCCGGPELRFMTVTEKYWFVVCLILSTYEIF